MHANYKARPVRYEYSNGLTINFAFTTTLSDMSSFVSFKRTKKWLDGQKFLLDYLREQAQKIVSLIVHHAAGWDLMELNVFNKARVRPSLRQVTNIMKRQIQSMESSSR